MKPQRYAHSDGHTDLCYDESGRYMLTCGADGDVRIWEGIECDDAVSHRLGDEIYAIACKNGRIFTARDGNTVQVHTFPEGLPDGLVTRFTAPVTHMQLSASGKSLAAGASDFMVKVVNTDNNSQKVFHGHEAPILSVALDPEEEFLASSSCDGTVRVWKTQDASCVSTVKVLPKCNDVSFSKTLCRLCWTHDGSTLLVPVEKEIRFYQRNTWELASSFTDSAISDVISILAPSPDKTHVAVGCIDGTLLVVNLKTRQIVDKHKHEKGYRFTAIAWNPSNSSQLAYCDKEGLLGEVKIEFKDAHSAMFESDDDDLVAASANLSASEAEARLAADPSSIPLDTPLMEDEDDPGDFMRDILKPAAAAEDEDKDEDDASSIAESLPRPAVPGFKPTPLQRPFQPGSTPDHLQSRFMMWNSVGVVRQYSGEDDNSIDVEFHDSAVHHPIHLDNGLDYSMADLSHQALALANSGDDSSASQLMVMHFASWDGSKEWTVSMPEEEEIQALVLGSEWVAVATSSRTVRVFTVSGIQRELFSLPGPVVCLAAHHNQLMVVFHRAMALPGEQCMGFSLLVLGDAHRSRSVTQDQALPLSPKASLSWLGFSLEGTPVYMDSAGIIRMLNRKFGSTFIQVANTRDHSKGVSDHYWIVGINEAAQQIRCIPCKGSRYPATLPRPAVSVLPFKLPLCDLQTEKGQYEELFHRTRLLSDHFAFLPRWGMEVDAGARTDAERPLQEALMKMFALAVRCDREFRAMEICRMMPEEHILQLAIRYASHAQHLALAQRISQYTAERTSHREPSPVPDLDEDCSYTGFSSASYSLQAHQQDEEEAMVESPEVQMDEDSKGPMLKFGAKESSSLLPKESLSVLPRLSRGQNPFRKSLSMGPPSRGTSVFDGMKETLAPLPISIRPGAKKGPKKSSGSMKVFLTKSLSSPAIETSSLASEEPTQVSTSVESPPPSQLPSPAETDKRPSAFQLWLETNETSLQESMADSNTEDFNSFAAEKFRALPKEERQKWLVKSKSSGLDKDGKVQDENKEVKRKREEEEDGAPVMPAKKKLQKQKSIPEGTKGKQLSETTNSKLKNFAFAKE